MKIAFCSISDRESIRRLSWPLMESYCKRQGYDFVTRTEMIMQDRHQSWSKIPFLRTLIPLYDIVIWLDDDIILTQPDVRVESLIKSFIESEKLFAVSENNVTPFNFGLIVVKKGVDDVLRQIEAGVTDENRYGLYWEETAGETLYNTSEEFKSQLYIYSPGILQGFHVSNCDRQYKWIPSCFALHASGLPHDYRIAKMEQTWDELRLKTRFCLHESAGPNE